MIIEIQKKLSAKGNAYYQLYLEIGKVRKWTYLTEIEVEHILNHDKTIKLQDNTK